ncbi:MAG: lamin tail domain-containing protein, partial [Myxococcales bacterium]|nr:lamin tail domain-containing protein [Myxococcales bacterium]
MRQYISILGVALALVAGGCGDDDNNTTTDTKVSDTAVNDTGGDTVTPDTVTPDTVQPDTLQPDTLQPDTIETDTTITDTSDEDTNVTDTVEDTGPTDTEGDTTADTEGDTEGDTTADTEGDTADTSGGLTPAEISAQITAIRGGTLGDIDGAWVTYVKAALGSDPAGFFIQAEANGPALFVKVDPDTLTPIPVVGDAVSFTATGYSDDTSGSDGQGRIEVNALSDFTVDSSGHDVSTLVQDVTAATDLVDALDSYESELVTATVTLDADLGFAGSGFLSANASTTGVSGSSNLKLRVPDIDTALTMGCVVDFGPAPVWRYFAQAQLSAVSMDDYEIVSCPAPELVSASALSATEVELVFSREIDPASVNPDGSDFTLDNGATVSAASVDGMSVTLTTSTLGDGSYTVMVGPAVTDTLGAAVATTANTATFMGPQPAPAIVISEIMARSQSGGDSGEYVELHNTTDAAISLAGCVITDGNGDLVEAATLSGVTISAGGYALFVKATDDFSGITSDGLFKSGTSLVNGGEVLTLT